ncbi:restriction endonuclease subunit S [Metabacillus fastidiosus]|uniref:Restriction endonuclease subunit S n=1 Tax=Metabacillus fastidiosus TaxID=1458 RepID=A0ABU6NZH1_9BACI|nr:restriction endonuclease subunit S [Metabacillus fastidiosus]MED4402078.1 restriction endonuclease subunit S [Metabacillus fastidiosus]
MKNKRTPAIRFAGFTEDWEQRKLGEVYTERKERGNDSLQILSVSIHHGVSNKELDSDTLGKKVRRSEDKSLYKHVYFGDLVFNMMRAWQGAIGVVKLEGMVSPAYITAIPSAQLYPLFMDYCLRRDETIIQIDNLSYGVTDFRKRLYWNSFINVLCRIPSVPEQERITAFFTRLDNIISLHQQELITLKQTKQGFLQKIFSQEIQFKDDGGNDFPEWELKDLKTFFKYGKAGGTPKSTESKYYNGNIPFLSITDITSQGRYITSTKKTITEAGLDNSSAWLVPADSLIFSMYASVGQVTINKIPLATSQAMFSMIIKETECIEYIYQYLSFFKDSREILKYIETGTQGNLNAETVKNLLVPRPVLKEQQKIANFLARLDDIITLHQRELDVLKETKKAFLQKMFV